MEVIDRLAAFFADVEQQAIALLTDALFFCNFARFENEPCQQMRILFTHFVYGRDVLVGDEQNMNRRSGVLIPKGGDVIILINNIGFRRASNDLAENTLLLRYCAYASSPRIKASVCSRAYSSLICLGGVFMK